MSKTLRLALVVGLVLCFTTMPAFAAETVEYYSMWNQGEDQQIVLQKAFDDFEAANPGVKVKVTWAGRDVLTKSRTRLLMGNPPDLMDQSFNELWASLLASQEMVQPLDDLIAAKGPEGQDRLGDLFYDEFLSLYVKDGKTYFIPYELITSGFYYDKNMFKEHGLEVPETWNELVQLSEKLKAAGIPAFAQDATESMYNAYWYYWLVERMLGKGALMAAATDATGKTLDDPGYLKAAELLYDITKAKRDLFVDGYEGSVWPAGQISWANGDAAMLICGTWIPNETNDARHENFEIGYFPFPRVEGYDVPQSMEAYLIGFAVPKKAKNPELAKELIRFVLKEEYQELIATQAQNMPARKDVAYPEILADARPYIEQAEDFHIEYDATQGRVPEWFNMVFGPLDDKLLYGVLTPEEFISKLKQDTIDYWARKR